MLNQFSCFRLLSTCVILLTPSTAIANSLFDAQELDPKQVIAIARPYGEHKYDLLILKQIPGQRQCWQEEGSNPTTVVPLLLNFDFTGICERSTDSNGYSLRIDGQDLGLDYLLRIVEREGELWLVGTHRQDKTDVAIGRTHGLKQGFLKIDLELGWQFASRAYQGKTLSHVYLTGDRAVLQAIVPAATSPSPVPKTRQQPAPPSLPEPLQEITFTADSADSGSANQSPIPDRPVTSASQSPSRSLPPLPVAPRSLPPRPIAPRSLPPAPDVNRNVNSAEPLPSFSELPPLPPPPPVTNPPAASGNGRKTLSDILTLSSPSANATAEENTTPSNRVPQPPSLKSGNRAAPLPPSLAQQTSYRVLVNPDNKQTEVKSRYPDAFMTSYQGRSLLQIGRFSSQENAQKALSELESLGVRGIIIQ